MLVKDKILDSDKKTLKFIELLYKSRLDNSELLLKAIKNKNFKNSQNYILWKNLVEKIKKSMNITENWRNLIWFSRYKKIQEIEISKINSKNRGLKYMIFWFDIVIFFVFILDSIENWFQMEYLFIFIFLIFFTIPWFYNFNSNNKYSFFKNKNKIIIFKK